MFDIDHLERSQVNLANKGMGLKLIEASRFRREMYERIHKVLLMAMRETVKVSDPYRRVSQLKSILVDSDIELQIRILPSSNGGKRCRFFCVSVGCDDAMTEFFDGRGIEFSDILSLQRELCPIKSIKIGAFEPNFDPSPMNALLMSWATTPHHANSLCARSLPHD